MFGDFCLIPVALTVLFFCILLEMACMKVGKFFGIWKVDVDIDNAHADHKAVDDEFFHLLERLIEF